MSGICGYVGMRDEPLLKSMTSALAPREGESEGFLYSGGEYALGWRGAGGSEALQPAHNEDKSVFAVCDGRICNRNALRARLETARHKFSNVSDADIIVHAYEEHGIGCVELFAGEFSFALWDESEFRMIIARDRIGAKSLYYILTQDSLMFASTQAALRQKPGACENVDFRALDDYLAFGYIPGEKTFFSDARRLHPGYMLICQRGTARISRYWELSAAEDRRISLNEWTDRFIDTAKDAVAARMSDEGPAGVILDAGDNSSVLRSILNKIDVQQLKIYSPIIDGSRRDVVSGIETSRGPNCRQVRITPDILKRLPAVCGAMEEPAADVAALIFDCICGEAGGEVGSLMGGWGLENLFGAGALNSVALNLHKIERRKQKYAKWVFAAAALVAPRFITGAEPGDVGLEGYGGRLKIARLILSPKRAPARYETILGLFSDEQRAALYSPDIKEFLCEYKAERWDVFARPRRQNLRARKKLAIRDLQHRLPCVPLSVNESIAAMRGLAVKTPFMDHHVVERALGLPESFCDHAADSADVLHSLVDSEEIGRGPTRRRRVGGRLTDSNYLPEFNRIFAEYLSPQRVNARGWFNHESVAEITKAAAKGSSSALRYAYSLAVLELWLDSHLGKTI